MTYQYFQLQCFQLCTAFGYTDMRVENSPFLLQFFTAEMLDAVIENKIKFYSEGEHWTDWFVEMCKKELDNRLDATLLGAVPLTESKQA